MKRIGYIIGLVIGIPVFILIVNFFFFRGNDPSEQNIEYYVNQSVIDTVSVKAQLPEGQQYIVGLSRRGGPSAFFSRYPFYSSKYKKFFEILIFEGFDSNTINGYGFLGSKNI